MNIQKIKAALAKQAQLLGVSPVATVKSAFADTAPAVVTKKETKKSASTVIAASTDSVPVESKPAPVTISANPKLPLFDTAPTVTPNIAKIPSESKVTVPVTISSAVQTPTLPASVFPASQLTMKTAADSVKPPLSIVQSKQLSITPEPLLIPEEPTKPARKTKKKVEPPVVIVEPKAEPIEVIVAKHLKAGRDYDRLPGTSKPTLFKSGAEILCGVFGFRTTSQVIHRIEDYDKQFILYEVLVKVFGEGDKIVAVGIGSCNSQERKYLRGDFATQLNTILKMAKKRAYVDAIMTACHASKVFTQDVEDIAAADDVNKKGA